MHEDRLRQLLEKAVTHDEPPLRGGPDAVFVRADALRARRRTALGLGGFAAIASIAAIAMAAWLLPARNASPAHIDDLIAAPPLAQAAPSPESARVALV